MERTPMHYKITRTGNDNKNNNKRCNFCLTLIYQCIFINLVKRCTPAVLKLSRETKDLKHCYYGITMMQYKVWFTISRLFTI